jgi:hypothetical protein
MMFLQFFDALCEFAHAFEQPHDTPVKPKLIAVSPYVLTKRFAVA